MSNSYKFYSDTKDIMKKYVNATEGAIIYGISKSRIMVLASEAGAVYKVGNSALINTDILKCIWRNLRNQQDHCPNIFGINCQAKIKKTTIVPVLTKKTRDCHFRHYRN